MSEHCMRNPNIILDKMAIYFFFVSVAFHFVPLHISIHFHSQTLIIFPFPSLAWVCVCVCLRDFSSCLHLNLNTTCFEHISMSSRITYFHTEYNVAVVATAVVVFSVYRSLLLSSKGRDEMVKCEHRNICRISIRVFVWVWVCVTVFINTISKKMYSKSLNLKSKNATEIKIYCLFTQYTITLSVYTGCILPPKSSCAFVKYVFKMWPKKKLGQLTAMVCRSMKTILIIPIPILNHAVNSISSYPNTQWTLRIRWQHFDIEMNGSAQINKYKHSISEIFNPCECALNPYTHKHRKCNHIEPIVPLDDPTNDMV